MTKFELTNDELRLCARMIEEANIDNGIWFDYEQRTVVVTEQSNWPLAEPWRYCFLGYAGQLIERLGVRGDSEQHRESAGKLVVLVPDLLSEDGWRIAGEAKLVKRR